MDHPAAILGLFLLLKTMGILPVTNGSLLTGFAAARPLAACPLKI